MKKIIILLTLVFLTIPALAQYVAQDPTSYIPNARVIGLGKAYFGLADDVASLYTNPAGLTEADGWQFTSMSGKFLDEYNYLSFSGLYPTNFGVLGIGFAGTSISGAFATTKEGSSDPADPIYTINLSQPQMGNYNNAFVFSYGNEAKKLPLANRLPEAEKISLGANLKIFQVALYGDGIVNGDARGMELDLGLKYTPQPWLKVGAALKNLLPAAMGGKLSYASGHEEGYPAMIGLGGAFNLIGKEKALRQFGDHQLKLALDVNQRPTLAGNPPVWHAGLEWKPIPLIALRAGLDQDSAGDGMGGLTTVNDLAYGVGFFMGGFSFDYAYHTFTGAPNIDNHFFSLSYAFQPPPPVLAEKFVIDEPQDKLITFAEKISVSGNILEPTVKRFRINNNPVRFGLRGEFQTTFDLKTGKNVIEAEVLDNNEAVMQSKRLRSLRLTTFPDVPVEYWTAQPISLLAMSNVVTGYLDGSFRPEGKITRAELCALLMRTADSLPVGVAGKFDDVKPTHWASRYISQASELGVVKGYVELKQKGRQAVFKPNANITRAEGLAMIARFAGISEEVYEAYFPDLGPRHWVAGLTAGAYRVGMIDFLKGKSFEPNRLLTRAEVVEMFFKTNYMKEYLAKGILNWEAY